MNKKSYYQEQAIGGVTDIINQDRVQEMNSRMLENFKHQDSLLQKQDLNFSEALKEVNKVRDFVNNPQNILGSNLTKHGEVAESLEVNITNAQNVLEGKIKVATFEGVGRTAPEDYLINGIDIQSKFYNGINQTLNNGILDHMKRYANFGRDGSFYHIPKDQYITIEKVLNGESIEGLSQSTINAIKSNISKIELQSGQNFTDVIKPAISNYDEVQLGVVHNTIDGHQEVIEIKHKDMKNTINDDSKINRESIEVEHQPSFDEALKVIGIAAALGGVANVVLNIYQKKKEGKSIATFSADDWKSVGVDFSKGAIKGGVIYGITNNTNIGAPIASAMVSASFGIAKLAESYKKGEISQNEYIDQGQLLCLDSGAVGLGATAGQVLIPIPIIGALVGTYATKIFMDISAKHLSEKSNEIKQVLDKEYSDTMARFDVHYQKLIHEILEEYENVGGIMKIAFDFDMNNSVLNLNASIELAELHGVDEKRILRTDSDFESFFLG
ncbi:MAG: Unknown protein [uncultured Sulfurovum sp.]|uniref:Uncharacterized protein n=1 Tax=uncultured Sulfurovum sp. TaxID=269237 RepID=A0A6S6TFB9_9BACT|nr:MAG: Unknown protein [uncultured Sulfurovum sp.]